MKNYWKKLVITVFPVSLGLIVLWPITHFWFFSDDFYWINFGRITLSSPHNIFTHTFFNYYRPVINMIFVSESLWSGLNAFPRHLLNLLIHVASTGILGLWLLRLSKSLPAALAGSLLFLLGPVHLEPVIWISGRTDLAACFFLLLSLCLLPAHNPESASSRVLKYSPSVIALCFAMFSKETAVIAPLIILINDWITREHTEKFKILEWIKIRSLWIAISFMGFITHLIVQLSGELTFGRFDRPITLLYWFKNTLGGVSLSFMQFSSTWFQFDKAGYLIFAILAIIAILYFFAGNRLIPGGFVIAVLLMIPSAAVPFLLLPEPHLTFGRFIYIPMIGTALFIAGLLKSIFGECIICMYRPALAIMIFMIMISGDLHKSSETMNKWRDLTDSRLQSVKTFNDEISTVSDEKPVIIICQNTNIWPEMFQLFINHDVEVKRSPEGLNAADSHIFIFDQNRGTLVRISNAVL